MKINFGKYKGSDIRDVPNDYIEWLINNSKETISTYTAELERRKLVEEGKLTMVEKIVSEGYRSLAKKAHPDTGGSAKDFHELQAAKAQLDMILKEVAAIK